MTIQCPHMTGDDNVCTICQDFAILRSMVLVMREWQKELSKTGLDHSQKESRKKEKAVDRFLELKRIKALEQ